MVLDNFLGVQTETHANLKAQNLENMVVVGEFSIATLAVFAAFIRRRVAWHCRGIIRRLSGWLNPEFFSYLMCWSHQTHSNTFIGWWPAFAKSSAPSTAFFLVLFVVVHCCTESTSHLPVITLFSLFLSVNHPV